MAVALPERRLIDPFHGEEHLRDRLVRALHEQSFIDDPTRIFRGARYETRLGFRMDPKTETLAMLAAPGVANLTGARIREELFAIFEEENADAALHRLRALGVEEALQVRLVDPPIQERLRELAGMYGLARPRWHLGLLSILAPEPVYDEWKVTRRVAQSVADAHRNESDLRARLAAARDAAEIVDACEASGPDTPLYALAREESQALRLYFERLRGIRLDLDGDDLAALGLNESRRVGEVLAELRRRKLNGELPGRAEELAAARELIAE
jgi:tRNA nucleotidyltransferase/poly(A) polymerase